MNWINNLLNKIKPTDDKPLTFITKIERPSQILSVYKEENARVKDFLDELLHHFNQNNLENFRFSNSLIARSQYANGLVINKPFGTSEETFMCVFDALKTNTEALNYRLNYQSCEVTVTENKEERKEVYYLKPQFSYAENNRYRQRFGNVKLERNIDDGKSKNITLLCTYYSGYNYEDPLAFEDFLSVVLATSE